jgi:hypothetical protein
MIATSFERRQLEKTIPRILRSSAFSHSLGQKLPSRSRSSTSAIPLKADSSRASRYVRFVPSIAEVQSVIRSPRRRGRAMTAET